MKSPETLDQKLARIMARRLPVQEVQKITESQPAAALPRWQLVQHGRTVFETDNYHALIQKRDSRCGSRQDCRDKKISVRQNPALAALLYGELLREIKQ